MHCVGNILSQVTDYDCLSKQILHTISVYNMHMPTENILLITQLLDGIWRCKPSCRILQNLNVYCTVTTM